MRYTTMDVGNIFKSLFRIYKTTKLLMQHHTILSAQGTHTLIQKLQQKKIATTTTFTHALTFPASFVFFFFLLSTFKRATRAQKCVEMALVCVTYSTRKMY